MKEELREEESKEREEKTVKEKKKIWIQEEEKECIEDRTIDNNTLPRYSPHYLVQPRRREVSKNKISCLQKLSL